MPVYFNMSFTYIIDDAGAKFEVTVSLRRWQTAHYYYNM
jgi:hypothetical protein